MTKADLENKLQELKMDYVRIQADLEKLGSTGGNTARGEAQLEQIETEIKEVRQALRNA